MLADGKTLVMFLKVVNFIMNYPKLCNFIALELSES